MSFFFFNQKTAYEMRISDWSSDVCSSDLMSAGFLGNDSQVGGALAQQFDDGGFRFAVGLRHQIVARFFINDEIVPAVDMRLQDRRRGLCGGHGGIKAVGQRQSGRLQWGESGRNGVLYFEERM